MSSSLLTLGLAGILGVVGLSNFSQYEQQFPIAIFQFSFMFLIYFGYANRVNDQKMNKGVFIVICLLKRIHKFVFFSFVYFKMPIRDMPGFINILTFVFGVGFVFIVVPLQKWQSLVGKFLPFRFIITTADLVFISKDLEFLWNQTINNPAKLVLFSKPEHEFLFFAFVMGAMSYIFDAMIQAVRRDKFLPLKSLIISVLNWGVGATLGYLGFIYFNEIQQQLSIYGIVLGSPFELTKKIMLAFFLILGGYHSQLPAAAAPAVKVEPKKVKDNKVTELTSKKAKKQQ